MTTVRRWGAFLAGIAIALTVTAAPAQAAPQTQVLPGLGALTTCSAEWEDGDRRLGPDRLPLFGPVGVQLIGYSRTGYRPTAQFLDRFWDAAANSWRYPPQDGYALTPAGDPIKWVQRMVPGQRIDRYGSEFGAFLAPAGSLYTTRSIPPSNLVGTPAESCNYRVYRVARAFAVDAGPIAPWFNQLGGGLQYQLRGALVPGAPAQLTVLWLVENGYLVRA